MNERIEKLKKKGCNISEAMERFLEDEEFYLDCFDKVKEDSNFERLGHALEEHDVKQGFECAHALKGVIANLGLTSLLDIIVKIVEPLRIGSEDGVLEKYQELMKEREEYLDI